MLERRPGNVEIMGLRLIRATISLSNFISISILPQHLNSAFQKYSITQTRKILQVLETICRNRTVLNSERMMDYRLIEKKNNMKRHVTGIEWRYLLRNFYWSLHDFPDTIWFPRFSFLNDFSDSQWQGDNKESDGITSFENLFPSVKSST